MNLVELDRALRQLRLSGMAAVYTKGTVIGGIVGGGVATGVVAKSKGYQVVLKEGTPLTFTTSVPHGNVVPARCWIAEASR